MSGRSRAMLINAYCTHRAPPPLAFRHRLNARRDRTDLELVRHLNGFMGYVTNGGAREMNQSRYAVLRHLQRVQHHLSLDVDEAEMDAFAKWASAANAILFLEDGSVRAPDGAVLVDPESGDADSEAEIPYPPDAVERRERSARRLAELGVHVMAGLPPVASEVEVALRAPSEVASRCLALLLCAVRAESIAARDEIPTADLKKRIPRAYDALSPRERAFVDSASPPQQEVVNHAWRYEALAVLAWAAGLVRELPPATAICDVPVLAKTLFETDGDAFVRDAKLRSPREILDALDLHLRLHWATTDARVNGREPPGKLDPGVVAERHYALSWLTCFEDAEWDDVDTPT